MEPFLRRFFPKFLNEMSQTNETSNYCKFNSQLLTLFTSSLYLAGLVATFPATWVTRSRGRCASMLTGGVTFLVGSIVGGFAVNISMLIAGRVMLGVRIGFASQVRKGILFMPISPISFLLINENGNIYSTLQIC